MSPDVPSCISVGGGLLQTMDSKMRGLPLFIALALGTCFSAKAWADFRQLTSAEVMQVQTFLFDYLGYVLQGPPDGIMGEKTRIALSQAQEAAGFEVTGQLTEEQLDLIQDTMREPPSGKQWAALSVAASSNNEFVTVSKFNSGVKAYRDAEKECRAKFPHAGKCITGVTYGSPEKPAWVAGMWCDWEEEGKPFVSFGDSKQDAYDRIAKQVQAAGIPLDNCNRVASIKSDGTK